MALVGRHSNTLSESGRSLSNKGYEALEVIADITNEAQVNKMVDAVIEEYGRIDILVNSAGHAGSMVPLQELGKPDWDAVTAVNLTGPYLCCNGLLRASALGRFATPEEIATSCVFLASDDSSMITGEALNFSGGAIMH